MKPRHIAVVSGLALTLALGAAHVTTPAFADADEVSRQGVDASHDAAGSSTGDTGSTDNADEQLPPPSDYDKSDFYEDAPSAATLSARSASSSSLSSVAVSSEMKYFTKYESHSNYRQGLSSGDGYNALGYYQFDRRYSLIPFLKAVYQANPTKYAMLKAVIDRGSEVASASSLYRSGSLTELGQLVQNAWYAAYDTDPAEFSAFQDSYAYNSYYVPTEKWLKSELGIDMTGRADCVKGMVWGLSNMWGTGGVKKVLRGANLSNGMTDREFVTALSKQMTDNIAQYSSQTQYYTGWKNRYRNELNDCLAYIVLHEAQNDQADQDAAADQDGASEEPGTVGDAGAGAPSTGEDGSTPGDSADGSAGTGGVTDEPAGESGDDAPDDASGSNGNAGQDSDATGAGSGSEQDGTASGEGASNAADDSADEDGMIAGSGSAGNSVSKPSLAPSAPAGGGSDGSGAGTGDETEETDGSATGSTSTQPDSGDATGLSGDSGDEQDESASASTSATAVEMDSDKQDEELERSGNGLGSGGGSGSTDDSAQGSGSGSSDEGGSGDTDGAARMPQTSDLVMFVSFAGASAATFGATFIAAGKHGLGKRRDDDAE